MLCKVSQRVKFSTYVAKGDMRRDPIHICDQICSIFLGAAGHTMTTRSVLLHSERSATRLPPPQSIHVATSSYSSVQKSELRMKTIPSNGHVRRGTCTHIQPQQNYHAEKAVCIFDKLWGCDWSYDAGDFHRLENRNQLRSHSSTKQS